MHAPLENSIYALPSSEETWFWRAFLSGLKLLHLRLHAPPSPSGTGVNSANLGKGFLHPAMAGKLHQVCYLGRLRLWEPTFLVDCSRTERRGKGQLTCLLNF